MKNKGYVYLVGAGPGDPGLITLKGVEAIKKADVILIDRLVSKELLKYAREDAEVIYVGKEPGQGGEGQEEIIKLMIDFAEEGKVVVRLKGGDPMIFGRGGEETEALSEAKIDYEVIPGVSSYHAAPAYAGIPLTRRFYSSSFAVVTGREALGKKSVDIKNIAKAVDTIVLMMGISELENIEKELIEEGIDPNTPVAIIEKATTKEQRTLFTKLSCLSQKARKHQIKSPSVIVIGKVVELARKNSWKVGKIIEDL